MVKFHSFRFFLLSIYFLGGSIMLFSQRAEHLPPEINSEYEEREPTFSPDGRTMYFWRRACAANVAGVKDNGDIWITTYDKKGDWTKAIHPNDPLNSPQQNFVWQVSAGNDTLWSNRILLMPNQKDAGVGYHVRNVYGDWSPQRYMEIEGYDYKGQFKDYFITPQRVLIVTNVGVDTYGGTDLYAYFPINDTTWGNEINLGTVVNTPGDEDAPFLASDGKTLYFNSNGYTQNGDHDVYFSMRLDNTWKNWSKPKPVGKPINSSGYDYDFQISPDGQFAYWCSDQNTYGGNDIFRINLNSCELTIYPESNITLCKEDSVVLEAGFTQGNPTYRWLRNGVPIAGAGYERTFTARESGQYQVVRIKKNCQDTSEIRTVTFKDIPSVNILGQTNWLCQQDSILLMAVSATGVSYQWQRNGKPIMYATKANYYATLSGEYNVRVTNGICTRYSEIYRIQQLEKPILIPPYAPNIDSISKWRVLANPDYSLKDYSIRAFKQDNKGNSFLVGILDERNQRSLRVDAYNSKGEWKWGNPQRMRHYSSAAFADIDEQGNVYVTSNEFYLVKYSPNGGIIWQKDTRMEMVTGVAIDPMGNIITTGRFTDTLNIDGQEIIPGGLGHIYIAKHNPSGKLMWIRLVSSEKNKEDFGNNVSTDCVGNIYVVSRFNRIANFANPVLRAISEDDHFFVAKYLPNGRLDWAKKLTSPRSASLQTGDVYTDCAGNTLALLNQKLYKLSSSGNTQWVYSLAYPETPSKARLKLFEDKLYISGISGEENNYFIVEINTLTGKQYSIWKGKHAKEDGRQVPSLHIDDNGKLFFAGMVKGRAEVGTSPSNKIPASFVISRYANDMEIPPLHPLQICPNETITLQAYVQKDAKFQWTRNGKPIPNAFEKTLVVTEEGDYQIQLVNQSCRLYSEIQSVQPCDKKQPKPEPPLVAQNPPPKKEVEPLPPPPSKPQAPKSKPPKPDLLVDAKGKPASLKKRKVKIQNEIEIEDYKTKISVWDYAAEDNDTISLNVNGKWVIERYALQKKHKTIEVELKPNQDNYILLYAHNLGAVPPNTIMLAVDDGVGIKTTKLESDLKSCGYVRIRPRKIKKE